MLNVRGESTWIGARNIGTLRRSAKTMAITIDDLPFARHVPVNETEQIRITSDILNALDQHRACCLGFAVGSWTANSQGQSLLASFARGEHVVCNHGHFHRALTDMTLGEFEQDLLRSHAQLSRWMGDRRYFRFPYLRMGRSRTHTARVLAILAKHRYANVPVTIDLEDWRFDDQYRQALLEPTYSGAQRIIQKYSDYIQTTIEYFDTLARLKLRRSPHHLFLLHANRLNGDSLSATLRIIRNNGWDFIHPLDALADPIYAKESKYHGRSGVSWLYHI